MQRLPHHRLEIIQQLPFRKLLRLQEQGHSLLVHSGNVLEPFYLLLVPQFPQFYQAKTQDPLNGLLVPFDPALQFFIFRNKLSPLFGELFVSEMPDEIVSENLRLFTGLPVGQLHRLDFGKDFEMFFGVDFFDFVVTAFEVVVVILETPLLPLQLLEELLDPLLLDPE